MSRIQRRARDGTIIPPMTLGGMRALGVERVLVSCAKTGCGFSKACKVSTWPDDFPVPDVGIRLTYPRCGAVGLDSRPSRGSWPTRGVGTRPP